jgi:2,3-bisphosphoglycerate-independent phosphoglycerate mutase
MADYAIPALDNKTPLQIAKTPHMDRIAACRIGRVKTIPDGMEPGSDVANLSLLGYDPLIYHTGRAPLEAASMGVDLGPDQVAFRMNLVTLDRKSNDDIVMVSHSSGNISTPEAKQLVRTLKETMNIPPLRVYPGVAYRHLLVWDHGPDKADTIPPHDVLGQNMALYLNRNPRGPVQDLVRASWEPLENHPVNRKRRQQGLMEANSIWLWGQGKAPQLPLFSDRFGLRGGSVSAVDLLKGIGANAGFERIHVEGATGYLDTNYQGKAEEALKGLNHLDFVFVHVEAPDEASHEGSVKDKIRAIESFDEKVVGVILRHLDAFDDLRVMVVSDHYTPISKKTHTNEPAPFAWADKKELTSTVSGPGFSERNAEESGIFFEKGHDLMPAFLEHSSE